MPVKLLPKSQLQALKEKERSIEVREGVKLATRIDGLRQLQANTEQQLETYRVATLTQIGEEISVLNSEKERISAELKLLKEEYEVLMPEIPLKRAELSQFEKKLMSWDKRLEKREGKADLLEIDIAEAMKNAENLFIRHQDNERISRNVLIQANKKREEAESTLVVARNIQERAYKDKDEIETLLSLREISIKSREKELSNKEISIMKQKREIDRKEVKVEDMRQTLERSLDRIRQGRLA